MIFNEHKLQPYFLSALNKQKNQAWSIKKIFW